jgi:putative membrane protein
MAERVQLEDVIAAMQAGGSFLGNLLLVTVLVLLVILLLPLVSVLGALFRYYGYRLTADGETYVRTSGLLTRHEESMKRHKVQAIVLRQNFIARFFKRMNMQLRVASAGSGVENGQVPTGTQATFMIPVLRPAEISEFGEEFLPGCEINAPGYSRVNRRRLTTVVLGLVTLCVLPVTGILGFLVSWKINAIPLLILPVAWLAVSRYWKNSGYAVAGEYGFVRHGFVGSRTTVFPLFKVQRADIRQSPGQRRRGLANLSIHLASHSLTVPHMDVADAHEIRDLALYYVESSDRPWY